VSRAASWVAAALVGLLVGVTPGCSRDGGDPDSASRQVTLSSIPLIAPRPDAPTLAWGPTVVDLAVAQARAAELPLEVAAGQVMVAQWSSTDAGAAAELVRSQHLAGVIVMGGAVQSREQVAELTAAVTAAGAEDGRSWPAIVSVDQEGGPVARLGGLVPTLPAFMAAGSSTNLDAVTAAYSAQAADLRGLGFTVDWAPDADLTMGAADTTIGVRSPGYDPARGGETVKAAIAGFLDGGVLPSVKHFPGHGSVTTDSHQGLPVQGASVAELEQRDLVPFAAAIDAGVPMVMLGHIEVPEWGAGPVTTQPAAYEYLRDELGFTGVAATDAMNMAAVADAYPSGQAEVAALAAGADLIVFPRDAAVARQAIVDAVTSGQVPRERLDEAVARVSQMMTTQAALSADATVPASTDYARVAAGAWATVATPECGGALVGASVSVSGGFDHERAVLEAALAEHGIGAGGGTTVLLLGSATGSGAADVVVAMNAPWGLPQSTATTYVGLYGRSDEALTGLADVLAGVATPGGDWSVPGMPQSCAARAAGEAAAR